MKRTNPGLLGILIAEGIISKVNPTWVRMPPNNPKFDFLHPSGDKIDIKASMPSGKEFSRYWTFIINENREADIFILMAFDMQESLYLAHVWQVPGNIIGHLNSITIRDLDEWKVYERPRTELQNAFTKLKSEQGYEIFPAPHMPKITISITEKDRAFLDEHPELRPSGIFRAAMQDIRIKYNMRKEI